MNRAILAVAVALFVMSPAFADGNFGALRGRVTDLNTHAGVAGVTVVVRIQDQDFETRSGKNGVFTFLSLPVSSGAGMLFVKASGGGDCLAGIRTGANQLADVGDVQTTTGEQTYHFDCHAAPALNPGVTGDVYDIW